MRVYLRTFGCRANHYDTEAVRALVERGGHEVVASPADADYAVFNSCAVTGEAERELRKAVRQTARRHPAIQSIVMGCSAALDEGRPASTRLRDLPTVSHVVGGADLPAIAGALGLVATVDARRTIAQQTTRAVLRVQDGCDEHCTFCATTMARGANRSRPAAEIIDEAKALAERHSEIVITGIHIGTYGADIGSSLGALLERLVREVPGARFRLSSIEASEVDERLFALLSGAPDHLTPHLHAPLQSGSDRLLRRMGRHWYTAGSYADAVARLAAAVGTLGLGADVIAGFPGETEEDHAATVMLVEQLPFSYLHVFPFSLRPGTAAERLAEHVSPETIARRARELRDISARKAAAYAASRAGGTADVVVLGSPGADGEREALTGDYLTVQPADPYLPRGARFTARLAADQTDRGIRLVAHRALA